MLRYSLLTLLIVVLVAAVGSAALANPTDTWRQVVGFLFVLFACPHTVLPLLEVLSPSPRSRRPAVASPPATGFASLPGAAQLRAWAADASAANG